MLSNVSRSVTKSNGAKSFFSAFYEWSVVNGSGSHVAKCALETRSFRSHAPKQHVRRNDGTEEPHLSMHLRDIMRKMPHSVVVATTSTPPSPEDLPHAGSIYKSKADQPRIFRGMTVSSFTTLTLTPTPIITFNIRKPSRTLDAIKESRQFLVHMLSATEEGTKTAHNFTQGNSGDVFAGVKYAVWNAGSTTPLPLLSSPGVTKVLRCKLREEAPGGLVEVGDHVLVLADVESIIEPPPSKHRAALEDRGLSYLDRAYREVGETIDVIEEKEEQTLENDTDNQS